MSSYRRIAVHIARRAFGAHEAFPDEIGAELRDLVQMLCEPEDAEWILEPGQVEARLAKLRGALDTALENFLARRMLPPLASTTATATFFRFTARITPEAGQEDPAHRARLALHEAMLTRLRALHPTAFERLCRVMLNLAGCTEVVVTRATADGGADFIGRLPLGAPGDELPLGARTRVLGALHLLLYGQGKRYSDYNKITLDAIKVLGESWQDTVRRRIDGELPHHRATDLTSIGWRANDAVVLVYATTSQFTRPALEYARHARMATLDGDQVSQLVLEAGLGVTENPGGTWQLDDVSLDQLLKE